MLEVESLDRMFLRASSLMLLIPSFSMCQHKERFTDRKYPLPWPKNTSNEENRTGVAAVVILHSPLDRSCAPKFGGARKSFDLCRRKKGETATCGERQSLVIRMVGNGLRSPCPRCQHHHFTTFSRGSFGLVPSAQDMRPIPPKISLKPSTYRTILSSWRAAGRSS